MLSQSRSMRVVRRLAAVLLGMVLLTGCVPIAIQTPATAPTADLVPIKVGTLSFISNSILYIAQEEGYFVEQGLAVEFFEQRSSAEFIPLLLQKELDIATPGLTAGFFNAVAGGGNIRMALPLAYYPIQACTTAAFIARQRDIAAGRYATPAQWRGSRMTLPVPDTGGTIGYFTDQALRQGGLTLQDVEIVPINTSIQAEALARGQTDIVLALEPWITRMLADPELGLLMPAEQFAPDMMASVIVYGEKPLTNPEIGKRFAVAYLKAVRQYANGKTERNIELLAAYTKLDPGLVEKTCWPASPVDGAFSMHSLIAYQAWLRERGLLDRTLSPDEFLDTQFVEAANERLAKEAK